MKCKRFCYLKNLYLQNSDNYGKSLQVVKRKMEPLKNEIEKNEEREEKTKEENDEEDPLQKGIYPIRIPNMRLTHYKQGYLC